MKESIKGNKSYPWCTVFVLINSFFERLAYYGIRSEFSQSFEKHFRNLNIFEHFFQILHLNSIATLSLYLKNSQGISEQDSTITFHGFYTVYAFSSLFGAIISDSYIGNYR
jgi:dipeptide/tripeptide permease